MRTDSSTAAIELIADIGEVWRVLTAGDELALWHAQVEVTAARAPERVSWSVTGALQGTVEWELDDLDEITFARSTWRLGPAHVLAGPVGSRAARRTHDRRVDDVAYWLAERLGADLYAIRSDSRQPHVPADERAPRGAGTMLLGAMWLASPRRR
jgi:hypothetical protein